MATTQALDNKLALLRAVYDTIQQLQLEWNALQTALVAKQAYEQALVDDQRAIKDALEQLANLQKTELGLKREQRGPKPPIRVTNPARTGYQPQPTEPVTPSSTVAPPRPNPEPERSELQRVVTRFARYRLNQKDPNILAEFNRLAQDPAVPIGRLLAVLDWEATFVSPLHQKESPQEHLQRLELWEVALTNYQEGLRADIATFRRRYADVLSLWAIWQRRESAPQEWDSLIQDAQAGLRTHLGQKQEQIRAAQERIAKLQNGGGNKPA